MMLLFALTMSGPACAASLRPVVTLGAPVVRLADLFDDAGENAARVLGPAPAPGGRIVVEAAQLAALARQVAVPWKPVSTADRAVLERPGKPLPRELAIEVLRVALTNAGVAAASEIEAPALSLPMVPFESQLRPVVTQLEHDSATGVFSAILTLGGAEMAVVHVRVSGRVHETIEVMVPARRIQPSEVIRPGDLRPLRLRAAQLRADVAREAGEAVGLSPRTPLSAGQPMRLADLARPPLVRKGANVQMVLQGGGLSLVAQALALESGATGERVRVMNSSSRAVLEAMVIGIDRVRVDPDSLPVQASVNGSVPQLVQR